MKDDWRNQAACKGADISLFFPPDGHRPDYAKAKRYCESCPVRIECLEFAIATETSYGFFGGMTPHDRRNRDYVERTQERYGVGHGDMPGTTTGWYREMSAGIKPCEACRLAYNAEARRKRAAKKQEGDRVPANA